MMIETYPRLMLLWLPLVLAFAVQGDSSSCRRSKAPAATTPAPATAGANRETKKTMSNKEVRDEKGIPASKNVSQETKTLPQGSWGGTHIGLSITEGGASLEYDCAHGTIDQRVELDADGRFDVRGTHEEETGGPPPEISISNMDEPDQTKTPVATPRAASTGRGRPARYTGQVTGRKLTLTVTLTDTNLPVGTFSLVYGALPQIRKCL